MKAPLTASASLTITARVNSRRVTQGRWRATLPGATCGRGAEEIAAKAPYLLQRDPNLDQHVQRRWRRGGVVFAVKHAHRVVEVANRLEGPLAAGRALVVMHGHARHIHDSPAVL